MAKRRGRPTKLNEEKVERMEHLLAAGVSRTDAVRNAGISYQCFLDWMERGAIERRGQYFEFSERIKRAETQAAVACTLTIQQARITGNWQAAAWWLERRRPQEYRKVERIENTGLNGQPQQVEHIITWKTQPKIETADELSNTNGVRPMNGNGNLSELMPKE